MEHNTDAGAPPVHTPGAHETNANVRCAKQLSHRSGAHLPAERALRPLLLHPVVRRPRAAPLVLQVYEALLPVAVQLGQLACGAGSEGKPSATRTMDVTTTHLMDAVLRISAARAAVLKHCAALLSGS